MIFSWTRSAARHSPGFTCNRPGIFFTPRDDSISVRLESHSTRPVTCNRARSREQSRRCRSRSARRIGAIINGHPLFALSARTFRFVFVYWTEGSLHEGHHGKDGSRVYGRVVGLTLTISGFSPSTPRIEEAGEANRFRYTHGHAGSARVSPFTGAGLRSVSSSCISPV